MDNHVFGFVERERNLFIRKMSPRQTKRKIDSEFLCSEDFFKLDGLVGSETESEPNIGSSDSEDEPEVFPFSPAESDQENDIDEYILEGIIIFQ